MKTLASTLAKMEGKKHQASIGDIREILKLFVMLEADCLEERSYPFPQDIIAEEVDKELAKRAKRKK